MTRAAEDAMELQTGNLNHRNDFQTSSWLSFRKKEDAYIYAVSHGRLKSKRWIRIDSALFGLLCLFMLSGWQRVYNAGHITEINNMVLSGTLYFLGTCLFVFHGSHGGLLWTLQRKFRLHFQILTYTIAMYLFSRHIALPNMGACSPFVKDFSALEALVIYLIWAAMTPVMAAIPLKYAMPLQVMAFIMLEKATDKECDMGGICARTDEMYELYNFGCSKVASGFPISVPLEMDFSVDLDCRVVMGFLKLYTMICFSFFVTYTSELSSRQIFALESGMPRIAYEMMRRSPLSWQVLVEMAFLWAVCWHTMLFWSQIPKIAKDVPWLAVFVSADNAAG